MNKFLRDASYIGVRNAVARVNPNFDQYLTANRLPSVPRIVVYSSNIENDRELLNLALPPMKWIAPRGFDYSTSDESISKHVANQLITADPMMTHQGYILEGFPFTVKQALLLDRFVQGINLAIYFRHQTRQYEQSVSQMLDYYDQKGNLLVWQTRDEKQIDHQVKRIWREIVSNIKLS